MTRRIQVLSKHSQLLNTQYVLAGSVVSCSNYSDVGIYQTVRSMKAELFSLFSVSNKVHVTEK